MPELTNPPTYDSRTVREWLAAADREEVLLPNFQRSRVWKPQLTAAYILALLERRPTGMFLVLAADDPLPFSCRFLGTSGIGRGGPPPSADKERELVLDGQQRLTSLWEALSGKGPKRFLVRVRNLAEGDLRVEEVAWRAHSWSNPARMYGTNWIPVDILHAGPDAGGTGAGGDADGGASSASALTRWCETAAGEDWPALLQSVTDLRARLLDQPKLQYCLLGKDTDRDTAVDIFINVNRSAVKLKEIDIAVAIAEAEHGVDLRARIEEYLADSQEVGHYFSKAPNRAIPEVSAWMLKVACLKVRSGRHPDGLPPKESHYPSAVQSLCGNAVPEPGGGTREANARIVQLAADLDAALSFAAERGGATKRTLPAWPPVHVIAALQEDLRQLDAGMRSTAERLLSAYLWRGFLTERYAKLANTRLHEDYAGLRARLLAMAHARRRGAEEEPTIDDVPIFDDKEYPLPERRELKRAGWIGTASRLGRAIAAVAMQGGPLDWVTGKRLDPDRVRRLEGGGKLERRPVFPPAKFDGRLGDRLRLGLNGVLLAKSGMPPCDPADLLKRIRSLPPQANAELDELDWLKRVHSHVVPPSALKRDGSAAPFRYANYLDARADAIALEVRKLAEI